MAIFCGQMVATAVAGNTVLAKPAEQTSIIAHRVVELLYQAGMPRDVVQLLPGDGPTVGSVLTGDPRITGVVFTGGTDTARSSTVPWPIARTPRCPPWWPRPAA